MTARGAFTPATRQQILERDEGTCVVDGVQVYDVDSGYALRDWSIQHRRARGMGGSRLPDTSQPQNGIVVCGSATTGCHFRIESQPDWALANGYRVPQCADPLTIPITHHAWGQAWLLPDGTYTLDPMDVTA